MYSRLDSPIFKVRVVISLCGALFLGCLGLYELVKAAPSLLQLGQIQRNRASIEAISHNTWDNRYIYTINFQYVVNGTKFSKSENVSEAFYNQFRYTEPTVYYDRTQPSNAYIDLERIYSLRRDEVLFGGVTMIFCVVMFSFWYWIYFGRNQ